MGKTRPAYITSSSKDCLCYETGEVILKEEQCLIVPNKRAIYATFSETFKEFQQQIINEGI